MSDNVWIEGEVLEETELALKLDAGGMDVWLPKSQISDYTNEAYQQGDLIEVEIPEWLALEKDLL